MDHPVREREAEGHHERREHGERGCFGGRCDELPERLEWRLRATRLFFALKLFTQLPRCLACRGSNARTTRV